MEITPSLTSLFPSRNGRSVPFAGWAACRGAFEDLVGSSWEAPTDSATISEVPCVGRVSIARAPLCVPVAGIKRKPRRSGAEGHQDPMQRFATGSGDLLTTAPRQGEKTPASHN